MKDFENALYESGFKTPIKRIAIAFQYKTADGGSSVPVKIYLSEIRKIKNEWEVPKYIDDMTIKSVAFKNWYCDFAKDFKVPINDDLLYKHCLVRFKCKALEDKGMAPPECSPFL